MYKDIFYNLCNKIKLIENFYVIIYLNNWIYNYNVFYLYSILYLSIYILFIFEITKYLIFTFLKTLNFFVFY